MNPSTGTKISAVLPLATRGTGRDNQDLARMTIFLKSFIRFFSLQDLEKFFIITPPRDIKMVRSVLTAITSSSKFEVVSELDICPELKVIPLLRRLNNFRQFVIYHRKPFIYRGWYKQQLLKLLISKYISTHNYLVFDSDVICVREFKTSNLLKDGKSICNIETFRDYYNMYADNYAALEVAYKYSRTIIAEKVLRSQRLIDYNGIYYGETPVQLCTHGVSALLTYIEQLYNLRCSEALIRLLPWTEYPLYFQFLEGAGLLSEMHYPSPINTVLNMDNSLWQPEEWYKMPKSFETWNAEEAFNTGNKGYFIVIQSYLDISPELIWDRIKGWIEK